MRMMYGYEEKKYQHRNKKSGKDAAVNKKTVSVGGSSSVLEYSKPLEYHLIVQHRVIQNTKIKFTQKEDDLLRAKVAELGEHDWGNVASVFSQRTARDCRERWRNYLAPRKIVQEWTAEEDEKLLQLYGEIGRKWDKIERCFLGRTHIELKNRLQILMSRPIASRFSGGGRRSRHSRKSMVPRVDRIQFFTAASVRPAFTDAAMDAVFYGKDSYYDYDMDTERILYKCMTGPESTAMLPRLEDAIPKEIADGCYATIGHIEQWQDYCARQCKPELTLDGEAFAYRRTDVNAAYNDPANLKLQSMHYNSSIARPYGAENPLTPAWTSK